MAVITTAQNGLASATSTWVGGVVPIEGDKVNISHEVTIDGAYIWGDDTTTAINVKTGGTLKASRSVNSTLTCKGSLIVENNGTFDYGKSGDQIPNTVIAKILYNYSSALLAGKYTIDFLDGSWVWVFGATKSQQTKLASPISINTNTLTVLDATGWKVGDIIAVASNTTYGQHANRTITAINGNTITVNSNFTLAYVANTYVINVSNNVVFAPYNTSYKSGIFLRSSTRNNSRELQYFTIENIGGISDCYGFGITQASGYNSYLNFKNIGIYSNVANCYGIDFRSGRFPITVSNVVSATTSASAIIIYVRSGSIVSFDNLLIISGYQPIISNYSQGGVGCTFTNCKINSCNAVAYYGCSCQGFVFTNCEFDANYYNVQLENGATDIFKNCKFNKGVGTPASSIMIMKAGGALKQGVFQDCEFRDGSYTTFVYNIGIANSFDKVTITNKNLDVLQQEVYFPTGYWFRDNTTYKNSTSSLKLTMINTSQAPFPVSVPCKNGQTITIKGNVQYNANFVSGTYQLPTVTISGLGITPVVFTCASGKSGQWQEYTLQATNNAGYDGDLTVTFQAQSSTVGSNVWFDGLNISPYITSCRFYGYKFDETNQIRTINPYISVSESTAGAYTGITINGATKVITLSQNHTMQELYDYTQWWTSQSTNLAYTEPFITTDGYNYISTYDLVLNANLSGSGKINMSTKTLSGSGTSTLDIVAVDGTHTNIKLTNLVSGSRVQIYDTNNSTELYNAIVNSTSLTFPVIWTVDKNIRVRVMYVNGVTAKKWYSATGTLTNVGLSINVNQVDDTVYNFIGIDGSTVTECQIVGTILVININDPDNTTSAQRLYAFEVSWLYTEGGIRDQSLYIEATDSTHFTFEGGLKIKNTSINPLQITGGNIVPTSGIATDVFDLSGGTIFLNFNRVEGFAYMTEGGLTTLQADKLASIPSNPLLTTDNRLDKLDANISSRLATSDYTAPDNAKISDIKIKIDTLENTDLTITNNKIDGVQNSVDNINIDFTPVVEKINILDKKVNDTQARVRTMTQ